MGRSRHSGRMALLCTFWCAAVLWVPCRSPAQAQPLSPETWHFEEPASLRILDGYQVLHLKGSPEQLGRQHGLLARDKVRRVVDDVLHNMAAADEEGLNDLLEGAMVMEMYLPDAFRTELKALGRVTGIPYDEIVALQLFGDVQRAMWPMCSSFAAFGPATKTGELIAGRNLDFIDNGASEYAAVIICYYPDEGLPFLTISWAGIINGWTAMNAAGLVVSNNSAYEGEASLEGLSTCFMLRKIAQYATTVEEGVEIIRNTPKACGTVMMIAGGSPPNAAEVEYDHNNVAVRWVEDGYVIGTNSFLKLGRENGSEIWCSRYLRLEELIRQNYSEIDRSMNFAGAEGVPIEYMNLHSAMLYPKDLTISVSMGQIPACSHPYHTYRFTERGLVSGSVSE